MVRGQVLVRPTKVQNRNVYDVVGETGGVLKFRRSRREGVNESLTVRGFCEGVYPHGDVRWRCKDGRRSQEGVRPTGSTSSEGFGDPPDRSSTLHLRFRVLLSVGLPYDVSTEDHILTSVLTTLVRSFGKTDTTLLFFEGPSNTYMVPTTLGGKALVKTVPVAPQCLDRTKSLSGDITMEHNRLTADTESSKRIETI